MEKKYSNVSGQKYKIVPEFLCVNCLPFDLKTMSLAFGHFFPCTTYSLYFPPLLPAIGADFPVIEIYLIAQGTLEPILAIYSFISIVDCYCILTIPFLFLHFLFAALNQGGTLCFIGKKIFNVTMIIKSLFVFRVEIIWSEKRVQKLFIMV